MKGLQDSKQIQRKNIADMYRNGESNKLIRLSCDVIKEGFLMGNTSGFMATEMLDLGIKAKDLGIAMCMAIRNIPEDKLKDPRDLQLKQMALKILLKVVKN